MNMEIEPSHPNPSSESCGSSGGRDFVQELLERPFSARGVAEQKEIARMPRPTPNLSLQTTMGRTVTRFQEPWYSTRDWSCGSKRKNGLFCWPCLLFRPGKSSPWVLTGYTNMHSYTSDCKKHEKAKSHMEAYKSWKVFDSQEFLVSF